jgi:hypothetical protein
MDCVQAYEAENLATPRHGLPTVEGVGILLPRGVPNLELQVRQEAVVRINQGPIDFDALLHGASIWSFLAVP